MRDRDGPVLVVDDFKTMRRIVRNLLAQIGIANVEEAIDGSTALTRMRAGKIGLVISDLHMQPMSGLELLKAVRADATLKDTPFIVISSDNATRAVIAARTAGASSYIIKPFKAETLRRKIEAVLAAP